MSILVMMDREKGVQEGMRRSWRGALLTCISSLDWQSCRIVDLRKPFE